MNITKKIDRALHWAGEKMGQEAKTTMSEDFKMLETEMALRFDGMVKMQTSMNAYVKWLTRRGEAFEDKEKGLPASYLGRTMISHGEDFENDSEFGNSLIAMGRANERVSAIQERFAADATAYWLESLERSLAMMKEYQAARKKLDSRRLALDASSAKLSKARRDDFRIEEELRTAKAKYEESAEDVFRRMQDIKDAEVESVRDLTRFLDAEVEYHERCAEELRRARESWPGGRAGSPTNSRNGGYGNSDRDYGRPRVQRSRSNTAQSYGERDEERAPPSRGGGGRIGGGLSRTNSNVYEEEEPDEIAPVRMPIRSRSRVNMREAPDMSPRPDMRRSNTFQSGASLGASLSHTTSGTSTPLSVAPPPSVGSLRGQLRPVSSRPSAQDVFADHGNHDDDTGSSDSRDWAERSASPATSYGSLSRTNTSNGLISSGNGGGGGKKGPPPPPPSRAKKPPPPVPSRRELGY